MSTSKMPYDFYDYYAARCQVCKHDLTLLDYSEPVQHSFDECMENIKNDGSFTEKSPYYFYDYYAARCQVCEQDLTLLDYSEPVQHSFDECAKILKERYSSKESV